MDLIYQQDKTDQGTLSIAMTRTVRCFQSQHCALYRRTYIMQNSMLTLGPARMHYKISASVNGVLLIKYRISCSVFYYSFKFLLLITYLLEIDVNMNILTFLQVI